MHLCETRLPSNKCSTGPLTIDTSPQEVKQGVDDGTEGGRSKDAFVVCGRLCGVGVGDGRKGRQRAWEEEKRRRGMGE